jgi:hypothetical protein
MVYEVCMVQGVRRAQPENTIKTIGRLCYLSLRLAQFIAPDPAWHAQGGRRQAKL